MPDVRCDAVRGGCACFDKRDAKWNVEVPGLGSYQLDILC
jgi:hypothetical protein